MGVQPIRKTVAPEIPDKLYFRIGDVARLCEVPAYVLRFWETEFPQLKPNKGGTGQRLYRKRDVEIALRIKSLLYDQGFTIPGARQVFKSEARVREAETEVFAAPQGAEADPQQPSAADAPMVAGSSVEFRRRIQLQALRDDMQSLLNTLQGARTAHLKSAQPMRPRLVLEPRAAAPRLEMLRLVRESESQGDLFPGE